MISSEMTHTLVGGSFLKANYLQRECAINRVEAVAVLRKMSSVIFGLGTPEIITLGRKDDGCEIKIKSPLNNYNRKVLDEILQKHICG